MNKKELVDRVAESTSLTRSDVERVVDATVDAIGGSLADGDAVAIAGFGTFEVRHRAARKGRNPQTGEEIDSAATDAPAFKAASALKKRVAS
jgi:DNA-binding protein HU-beta